MKQEVLIGQTDYTVLVKIRDDAGAPATGLDEGDIDIAYARVETDNDVTTADVTPAALTALTDAHTDWGFEEVSASDHPGLYRLDIADAVFASGAWSAVVTVTGTGLDPADMEFVLIAFNPRDGVRLGLTALPNAAADAAGGLIISDAGGLDADAQLVTKINDILTDTGTTLDDLIDDLESRIGTPSDLGGGATISANLADIEGQTDDIAGLPAAIGSEIDGNPTIEAITQSLKGLTLETATIGDTGNDTTHLHLEGLTYGDDEINNHLIVIYDVSEDEYHSRWITDWVAATDLATVATLPFTPQNDTDIFRLTSIRQDVTGGSGLDAAGVRDALGLASANLDTQLAAIDDAIDSEVGAILADTNELQTDWANGGRLDLLIDAILADTNELQTDLVNGGRLDLLIDAILADTNELQTDLVNGGRLDLLIDAILEDTGTTLDDLVDNLEARLGTPSDLGSGATVAANLVDIEAQTDDIGAAGAGLTALATQASVNTIDDFLDTEIAAIKAKTDNLPSDPADDSDIDTQLASLSTKIDAIDDFLDTEIAAIKAKTDSLTFTVAGQVDSNTQSVNDVSLQGDGDGTPWGPA